LSSLVHIHFIWEIFLFTLKKKSGHLWQHSMKKHIMPRERTEKDFENRVTKEKAP
jgi:hypothetical protein